MDVQMSKNQNTEYGKAPPATKVWLKPLSLWGVRWAFRTSESFRIGILMPPTILCIPPQCPYHPASQWSVYVCFPSPLPCEDKDHVSLFFASFMLNSMLDAWLKLHADRPPAMTWSVIELWWTDSRAYTCIAVGSRHTCHCATLLKGQAKATMFVPFDPTLPWPNLIGPGLEQALNWANQLSLLRIWKWDTKQLSQICFQSWAMVSRSHMRG